MGLSDFARPPRDARAVTRDLHALLQNAGIRPPFVLVGSSLGGLYVVMYAKRYHKEVAGLVLVDPSEFHNWDFRAVAPSVVDQLAAWRRQSALCLTEVRRRPLIPGTTTYRDCVVGAEDVASACERGADACELAKRRTEHSARRAYITDFVSEQQSWGTRTATEILSDHRTFGSMPMIVLTGARTFAQMSDVPQHQRDSAEALWIQMHDRIATLSSRGKNFIVQDSGHVIQHDDPDAVISAIRTVVDQARGRARDADQAQ
jgi:pimeloyl-ACP methyl ester carboxylesterase